jgi:hypothetical protein
VERIWRQEGLRVPQKQPKRGRLWLTDGSCIRRRPEYRDHVWSYDFVLVPVLMEMIRWSAHHQPGTPVSKALKRRLDREPRKVADEFARHVRAGSPRHPGRVR